MKCKIFIVPRAEASEDSVNDWLIANKNIEVCHTNVTMCPAQETFFLAVFYKEKTECKCTPKNIFYKHSKIIFFKRKYGFINYSAFFVCIGKQGKTVYYEKYGF